MSSIEVEGWKNRNSRQFSQSIKSVSSLSILKPFKHNYLGVFECVTVPGGNQVAPRLLYSVTSWNLLYSINYIHNVYIARFPKYASVLLLSLLSFCHL